MAGTNSNDPSSLTQQERVFPSAEEDIHRAREKDAHSEQTNSPSYRLAFDDLKFISSDPMRPVRLMLELSKPELLLQQHNICNTVAIFGSTGAATKNGNSDSLKLHRHWYQQARELTKRIANDSRRGKLRPLNIITGGGPGIMEAANRGAEDANEKSIGLNIVLPKEQKPNTYITPELCFNFHYFAIRKMYFLLRSKAVVIFPGGFGTLDELFEVLTLIQTKTIKPVPVILFDRGYWQKLINWPFLISQGMITQQDYELLSLVNDIDQAMEILKKSLALSE